MSASTWAMTAFRHTQRTLVIGASNKPSRVTETGGLSAEYVGRIRSDDGQWQKRSAGDGWEFVASGTKRTPPGASAHEQILSIARRAAEFRAGNCGECAAVAYACLQDAVAEPKTSIMIGTVAYVACRPPGDHAFLVISRDTSGNGSVASWGADAVICDPWWGVVCAGTDVANATGKAEAGSENGRAKSMQDYIRYYDVTLVSEFQTDLIDFR